MDANLCAEARHPARLTSDVLRNICYHLDQLICATATVLQLCFRFSQTDNYAFQSECTLNVIRDSVRLEQNVYVFLEVFVKNIEAVHDRIRSSCPAVRKSYLHSKKS